jgi:diaminohydroxyphosphoribosylaminopyrimidine deaminase/5-amino-6-(5-phosphoribosylamino)uracil reductase
MALANRVNVIVAPGAKHKTRNTEHEARFSLQWLLKKLGSENVTSLLIEGGGEVNASFLLGGLAHRIAFFYAPKILGGRESRKGVAGDGVKSLNEMIRLSDVEWRKVGPDLLLTARVAA